MNSIPPDPPESSPSGLRLALLTGSLNLGGSTTFLLNLCGELTRRGIANRVICLEPQHPMRLDFEQATIDVQIIDTGARIFEDTILWGAKRCAEYAPTHMIGCLAPKAFEILRFAPTAIPRFGMVQSDDPIVYKALSHYGGVLDATIGVSKKACEKLLLTPGLETVPSHYLPYGIPAGKNLPTWQPSSDSPIRIIYLGRLSREQKRVHLFPQILDRLRRSGIRFEWTIAGEGEERPWLEKTMGSASREQAVSFTGAVSYADVPDLLRRQDIFLLASNYEGLPLSLLEAMANGVVPVVSDLESGIRDVVLARRGLRPSEI